MCDHVHTFLFSPSTWKANGWFCSASGPAVQVTGEACIAHLPTQWVNESWMRLPDGTTLRNIYELAPWPRTATMTTWCSNNPALGTFAGSFTVVQDSILALATTLDGKFTSHEFMFMESEDRYMNRGSLVKGSELISTWAVELTRMRGPQDG